MSRETNSLLLRYGLNTFWTSSLNFFSLSYVKFQFNSFFTLLLRNYCLQALKIRYNTNYISLYVFYFKEDRFSFVYKFLKLKKLVLNRIVFRKSYGFYLKSSTKNVRSVFLSSKFFFLIYKILISHIYFLFLKNKLILNQVFIYNSKSFLKWLIQAETFFKLKKFYSYKKKKNLHKNIYKYSFFWFLRIYFINNLIKFKWLGLFSTFLIYTYTNQIFKITLKSLTENRRITTFPFTFKYFRNSLIKQKYYLILLSFIFLKASILNLYINILLKKIKNKKHIKTLIIFFHSLQIFFEKQFVPLLGLKFKISGRLNGKLRKGSFGYKLGFVLLMSLNVFLNYSCDYVYTQYGSFSLKLWLCDNNEHTLI